MALRLAIGSFLAASCAATAWLLPLGSTYGQQGVRLKLTRGTLAVAAPAVSAAVDRSVRVTITVTDARGTGAGWSLKLASTRAVSVSRIAVSCAAGSTCTLPRASGIGADPVVFRARRDSGMGVMRVTLTLAPLRSGAAVPVTFAVA